MWRRCFEWLGGLCRGFAAWLRGLRTFMAWTPVIDQGEKFGAIALNRAWRRNDIAAPVHLGDDLWVLPEAPLNMQEHWQQWIGTIRAGAIQDANLWLMAKARSADPGVDNAENLRLLERAHRLLHALLLVGPIWYEQGFVLSGGNPTGVPEVRQFGDLTPPFRLTGGTLSGTVGAAEVTQAQTILPGINVVFDGSPYWRIRAGIFTFLRGLQREFNDGRVHQFVRALEGVIKPEIGKTKTQFIHRTQTFTGASIENAKILEECYDIRSLVEHLHDWQPALSHVNASQRVDRLLLHSRRLEALCCHVYGRLCTSVTHRDAFGDGEIDGFWKRPDHERSRFWGTPLNLANVQ